MSQARLTFDEAEKALAAFQTRGWRLGLDRMNAFVDELGLRDYVTGPARPMYFHVAGTNGKGSTTCFLQHLLHEHGYRVGACYSPYVYDVRERVQIGLDLISKNEFAACTEILLRAGEKLESTEFGGPTEFEMKTAMGFLAWQRAGVDAVALETGMGGRLDATNVVDPACSIITTIGLDHTEHLGPTLADIAQEKAGIIKPGRSCVIGRLPTAARKVVERVSAENDAPLWRLGFEVESSAHEIRGPGFEFSALNLGMRGRFQVENACLAVAALSATDVQLKEDRVRRALAESRLPGRMQEIEVRGQSILLDGAHNAQAASILAEELKNEKFTLIWGMTKGHSPADFLRELTDVISHVIVLPASAAGDRAASAEDLVFACREQNLPVAQASTIEEALDTIKKLPDTRVLVAGSFYLVSAFRAHAKEY